MSHDRETATETARGPLGDARPDARDNDPRTGGGEPVEPVEDRPSVGTVKPEDYPHENRDPAASGITPKPSS